MQLFFLKLRQTDRKWFSLPQLKHFFPLNVVDAVNCPAHSTLTPGLSSERDLGSSPGLGRIRRYSASGRQVMLAPEWTLNVILLLFISSETVDGCVS